MILFDLFDMKKYNLNFLIFHQNVCLTAYSVTGGRFPRARLQLTCIVTRPDTSGFSARAVPAGVCRPSLHMLLESFSFHQEHILVLNQNSILE